MRKKMVLLALALAAVLGAEAGLFTPASNAASSCYQVDCNICCPTSNGKVICTERACV